MLLGTISFILGILSLQWLPILPHRLALIALPLVCAVVWRYKILRLIVICFSLGFCWQYCHVSLQLKKALPTTLESTPLTVTGNISEIVNMPYGGKRFLLSDTHIIAPKNAWPNPGQLQLYWYRHAPSMQEGERWQFTIRLKRPRHYANPGSFDYAKMLFFKRIVATGYVDTRAKAILLEPGQEFIQVRKKIQTRIHSVLAHSEMASLISALGVGLRDTVTQDQWTILGRTGTNHLLAISGLHVGLVTGFIFLLLTRLVIYTPLIYYFPAQWIAAGGALIAAPIYGLLAGLSVPTQRAVIMVMIAMSFLMWRRVQNQWTGLAVSALLILLWDPFVAYTASFWLSFLAVGIIFIFAQARFEMIGFKKFLRHSAYLQWQISLGLVPITLLFFNTISWIGPIANFFAIPWVSFAVLPVILLAMCLDLIVPALGLVCWKLAALSLEGLWFCLHKLSQLDVSSSLFVPQTPATWLAIVMAIILLMLPRGFPGRWLSFVLIIAVYWQKPARPPPGEVWANVLDVGQGLAVVVTTHTHTLLFDAGGKSNNSDSGETVILPYLQTKGWDSLDMLILSHNIADHPGGAMTIKQALPVHKILAGQSVAGIDSDFCRAGQSWIWDQVQFEILYPFATTSVTATSSNNLSCVLKITTGDHSVLIPGDIERAAEEALVAHYGRNLAATALVVPHHGSLTSSTEHFLNTVAPRYALFATGYRNRFGFPKAQVVARYQAKNSVLYNTASDGAIMLEFNSSNFLTPVAYRTETTRWWH